MVVNARLQRYFARRMLDGSRIEDLKVEKTTVRI
jgi:hypothetical protein